MKFALFNTSHERQIVLPEAASFRDSMSQWLRSPNGYLCDYLDFVNAALGGLTFNSKQSYRSHWNNADCECVLFKDCGFGSSVWYGTNLHSARFICTYLRDALFRDCDLRTTIFEDCDLYNARFRNCQFSESFDYDRAVRQGARFENCTGLNIPPKEWEIEGI